MKRTFTALSSVVSVAIDDDLPGLELAEALLAGYPDTDEPAQLAFELQGGAKPTLRCVGRYETPVERAVDLVPLFELDLYHLLSELAAPGWLFHAAALAHDGNVFVFAGPSGAGKTTLALALLARGWQLVTEEIALVGHDLSVRGLARPIHLDAERKHPAMPGSWRRLEYPIRRGDVTTRHSIVQPPRDVRITSALPLRAIVRIDHDVAQPTRVASMPPHRALPRLWDCTLRQDDDAVRASTHVLEAVAAFELTSRSVADAVDQVERLASH